MKEEILSKIIDIVRNLREDGMVVSGPPTNSANAAGLGFDPKKDTPPVDLRKGKRRNWNPFFKNLARMQRRKPLQ